jgi:hypothetical protein
MQRVKKKSAESGRDELPETVSGFPDKPLDDASRESNPFTDPDWRMLGYAWSGFALRILLIAGGLFTVLQYWQARDETRIARTLELIELWDRPEYQTAQRALNTRIEALNRQYGSLIGADPTTEELRIYRERIGLEAMTESGGTMPVEEFREQFDRIVYFLNRLAFCVEGNLCKRSIADDYFGDFARSFWNYFAAHVERQRAAGAPAYAVPIEQFVGELPQTGIR